MFAILPSSVKFAIATSDTFSGLAAGEKLLLPAFKNQGDTAVPVVWDKPCDWTAFDAIIIRSCWDYQLKLQTFMAWIDSIGKIDTTVVLNPVSVIQWNMHKKYLLDLQAKGVPIPHTTLVERADTKSLFDLLGKKQGDEAIIKPCYGAAAFGIIKVARVTEKANAHFRKLLESNDVLIQAFVPEVYEGEYSAVFIGNSLSHVVLKRPKAGDYRANNDWGGSQKRVTLDSGLAARVRELYTLCGVDVLYARLDFVVTRDGPVVMELELIEPELFFDYDEHAATKFVQAARRLTLAKS